MSAKKIWEPGLILKEARLKKGISRREAGRIAGVSETWIRRIEDGVYRAPDGTGAIPNPSPSRLIALAEAVDVDPLVVLQKAGHKPQTEVAAHTLRRELQKIATGLDQSDLRAVLTLAEYLSRRNRK